MTARTSFLVVQYWSSCLFIVLLMYAITRSVPSYSCESMAPVVYCDKSVSRMKSMPITG